MKLMKLINFFVLDKLIHEKSYLKNSQNIVFKRHWLKKIENCMNPIFGKSIAFYFQKK